MSTKLFLLIALGIIQNTVCQVIGNGIGCNNIAGLPNGFVPTGFIPAGPLGPNLIGNGFAPIGYGDVAVAGELPVGGTTAVAGQVPVIGYVTFEGIIPAGGIVSVANNCGCNNGIY